MIDGLFLPVINVDACPSEEDLVQLLSGEEVVPIGLHVRECIRCQRLLDRLSDDETLRPPGQGSDRSAWDWGDTPDLSAMLDTIRERELSRFWGEQPPGHPFNRCLRPIAHGRFDRQSGPL